VKDNVLIAILFVSLTIVTYTFAKKLYEKYPTPLFIPLIVTTAFIVILLLLFNIDYETYMIGGEWIHHLLGPAVVALAYPLYIHRATLLKYFFPLLTGAVIGALIGISTGVILAKLLGFDETIIYSIAPKSVTTPVAMEVSESFGGVAPLAAVFVQIAGIGGVLMFDKVASVSNLKTDFGKGVGMGAASHAIGTSKLLETSLFASSVSTVSMIISAIVVSLMMPIVIYIFM